MLTLKSRVRDRVLRDNTAIVFNFDIELVAWQNPFAKFQNPGESIGPKPVFHVAPDMSLQQHLFFLSGLSTAIDKFPHDVRDLG